MAARVAMPILSLMAYALLLSVPRVNSEPHGFRATMIRKETTINFTRATLHSYRRLSNIATRFDSAAGDVSTEVPLREDSFGDYNLEFSIGTPAQTLLADADTGSDLVWVKCGQGSSSFDPTRSSTFSKLPCSDRLCNALESQRSCGSGGMECKYKYVYGFASDYAQGILGSDIFKIGSDNMQGVGFGCTTTVQGDLGASSGIVGLNSGPLSLVSQMGVSAFSYCLVDDPSKESPMLFGSLATITGTGVKSIPLIKATTLYAANLTSVSIGTVKAHGTGNNIPIVFDSGSTLTYLTEPAYTKAKEAILSQTSLPRVADPSQRGYEACFQVTQNQDISKAVPSMVLHFLGADMELPAANYFNEVQRGVICWVVQMSPTVSLIGSITQMNFHMRYDLDKKVLSFQQTNCGTLPLQIQ